MMGDDMAPLIQSNPSDRWPSFSNSQLNHKNIVYSEDRKQRSSGSFMTTVNLIKIYVGVAFITGAKSVA